MSFVPLGGKSMATGGANEALFPKKEPSFFKSL
jgi:hypothetical protein